MTTDAGKYLSDHLAHLGGRNRSTHRTETLRRNYVDVLPANRDARILEIGPGFGEFLNLAIHELGYQSVEAIDTSPEVVEYCQRICRSTTLVQSSSEFLRAHPQAFERIVLLHVLEHVPKSDILTFLTAIHDALKPETGFVVIEVPNMANPLTGVMFRYADFTHEVGFTSSSLGQVLRMAGFSGVEVRRSRTPRSSPLRLLQWTGKWVVELGVTLLLHLYQQKPDLVSANLVALAKPSLRN